MVRFALALIVALLIPVSALATGVLVGPGCTLSWDAVTTNSDGTALTGAVSYEIYTNTTGTAPVPGTTAPTIVVSTGTSWACGGLPQGQQFAWVDAVKASNGARSTLTASLPFVIDKLSPAMPANLRVQ
jgi:hypothetical protein